MDMIVVRCRYLEATTATVAPSLSLASLTSSLSVVASAVPTPGSPFALSLASIHVDRFVVFGGLGGGHVPARETMVGAFAGRVVFPRAGAAGVVFFGICHTVELIGAFAEEGEPLVIRITIFGWRGGINVEKCDGCSFFGDLEGFDFHGADDGIKNVFSGPVGANSVMVFIDKILEEVACIGHNSGHQSRGDHCDGGVAVI